MALGEGDKWTWLQISTLLVTICVTPDGFSPFLGLSVLICKMGPILLYLVTWMSADTFIWGTLQKTDPFYESNILFYFLDFFFFLAKSKESYLHKCRPNIIINAHWISFFSVLDPLPILFFF